MLPDLLRKIEKALKVILTVPCACGKDKALILVKLDGRTVLLFCCLKSVFFYAGVIVIIPPSHCHAWHLLKCFVRCMFVLFNHK